MTAYDDDEEVAEPTADEFEYERLETPCPDCGGPLEKIANRATWYASEQARIQKVRCAKCGALVTWKADVVLDGLRCSICAGQLVRTTSLDAAVWRGYPAYCLACCNSTTGGMRFEEPKQVRLLGKLHTIDRKRRTLDLFAIGAVLGPAAHRRG